MAGLERRTVSFAVLLLLMVAGQFQNAASENEVSSMPSPPTNVHFTVTSDERGAPIITATWNREEWCNRSCGYVVTCCIPGQGIEINTTVWASKLAANTDSIRVNVTGINPATRYVCKVAAFNANGIGNTGSNVFVETMEIAPRNSPTDVYASDISTDSFRINWRYSETPPPGIVSSFKIGLYYKDNRSPSRHGEHIRDMTFALSETDRPSLSFSYLVMYLDPGMEYNVLISAMTSMGEGPTARIGQKTMNTAPKLVPHEVTGSIVSFVTSEPPAFSISWSVRDLEFHLIHSIAGFLISCYANRTSSSSSEPIRISEPVFTAGSGSSVQGVYHGLVYFPNTCGSGVSAEVECRVAAFNSEGEGRQSEPVLLAFPCSSETPGVLDSSILSRPLSSLAVILSLSLLSLCLLSISLLLCLRPLCSSNQRKKISDSMSVDDNYVPMASTEAGIKSQWSVEHSSMVTGPRTSSVGVVLIERGDPPYDEIPADRSDNLYDEINPRVPGSTNQLDSGSSLDRPSTIIRGHTHSQLKTLSPDSTSSDSRSSLSTIPLPSLTHADPGTRDSTLTQYIELSSSVIGANGGNGGDVIRYSMDDSGVNMTSLNCNEPGQTLSPGSQLPRNGDVENVRFRRYPYFVTQIPPPGGPSVEGDTESSYYNTMIPFSALGTSGKKDEGGEQQDTERNGDMDTESGVGMESQVSESSTTGLCSVSNMEPGQQGVSPGTTVISLVGKTERGGRRGKKKWSGFVERESICEGASGDEGEGGEGVREKGEKDDESDEDAESKES